MPGQTASGKPSVGVDQRQGKGEGDEACGGWNGGCKCKVSVRVHVMGVLVGRKSRPKTNKRAAAAEKRTGCAEIEKGTSAPAGAPVEIHQI